MCGTKSLKRNDSSGAAINSQYSRFNQPLKVRAHHTIGTALNRRRALYPATEFFRSQRVLMTILSKRSHLILQLSGPFYHSAVAGVAAHAQDQNTTPDNSAQNKNQDQTAQNQSSAASDRELTAKVRKAIIADKDLSTYAHNIGIHYPERHRDAERSGQIRR